MKIWAKKHETENEYNREEHQKAKSGSLKNKKLGNLPCRLIFFNLAALCGS